jgi:hypothetical protein
MGKIIGLILITGIAIGGYFFFKNKEPMSDKTNGNTAPQEKISPETDRSAKEFSTTAYYDETGVWFSLKEMRVKKGDLVRVHRLVASEATVLGGDLAGAINEAPRGVGEDRPELLPRLESIESGGLHSVLLLADAENEVRNYVERGKSSLHAAVSSL